MADSKRSYGDVTYADPRNGKYPIDTEEHARAAWSYINQEKNAAKYPLNGVTLSEVKGRIRAACKKFGIDVSDSDSGSGASRFGSSEYMRLYPIKDIEIYRSVRDDENGHPGAIVEAYAAVFDQEAEIKDHEGHYLETIDRGAFDTAIAFAQRHTGGFAGNVKVLYNHGMTMQGTPAPEFQVPLGVPVDIKPDGNGVLTRTRYDTSDPFTERILGKIEQKAISAYSFTGRIIRSNPQLRRGDTYRPRGDSLPIVRRIKLGLREYGPVLWPAYSGAEILGVRMSIPGGVPDADEETPYADEAFPPDEGRAVTEDVALDPEHSARSHQHDLYRMRSKKAREEAGLVW